MPCHSNILRRLLRLIPLVLALVCLTFPAFALTKTFDSTVPAAMRLIDTGNATYEGYDIIVSGVTVTINGSHSFASLTVQSGGNVTHAAGLEAGMNLNISGNVTVTLGSYLSADGAGYPSATGPGKGGNDTSGNSGGGGASYGGEGQYSSGAIYGDVKNPTVLGSGGGVGYSGSYGGGSGGGRISLQVNGTLQIDGRMTANGSGVTNAGAGSGGSLLLRVGLLSGAGIISAYGGYANRNGGGSSGGGGGGGRIAIYYTTNNFAGKLSTGGGGSYDRGVAGAGTIFWQNPSQTQGDLWVQNDGNAGVGTTLLTPYTFDNVKVWNRGALTPPVLGTLDVTVLGICNILSGGSITAGGRGFGSGQGPGAGNRDYSGNSGGGGASYGGEGQYSSGAIYGDVKNPVDLGNGENLGSGGGVGYSGFYGGGSGGGAIRLTVNGTLQVDGDLDVNGSSVTNAGAGSGGSILIRVGLLSGAGIISAYGGYANRNGGGSSGGGGGGGRIAIYYTTNNFAGKLSTGGGGSYDRGYAGAGTIFLQNPSQTQGDLWVQNDGNSGVGTTLLTPYTFDNVKVWNRGALTPPVLGTLDVTVLGVCNILSGGSITAGGRGFGGGKGPGAGNNDTSGNSGGGGGGYGGKGTNAYNPGGGIYGSQTLPVDFGSGGGSGYGNAYGGGSGGGAIRLTVNGTLQVDGDLDVNGSSVTNAGAGSGGSLLLRVGLLSGAGIISAYGGYANRNGGGSSGGGGGGGRIAIYYTTNNFASPGVISVAGGGSYDRGTAASGTLFTQQTVGNLTISLAVSATTLGGGQQATGNVTLSGPAPTGGINIALASSDTTAAMVPSSVTIAEGDNSGVFPIIANSVSIAKTAVISAQLYDQMQSAPITVKPWLGSIRLNPGSVAGGATVTGTLTLNLPAPSGGLTVALASSDPALTFPGGATLTMAAGTVTQNFRVNVGAVTAAKTATVTATYLAENQSATVYLNPAGIQAQSVAVAPGSIVGGAVATGVVTLNGPAPSGGSLVALSSSDTATATVPAYVTVPAGQTSAAFTIQTTPTGTLKSVILSATLGVTQITTLTVRGPGVASLTLIPASIIGGSNSIGIVTLEAPATAPVTVTISSNQSAAVPAASVIIPVGQTTGNFTIATSAVTTATTALLTARANGTAKSQGLSLYPVGTKLAIATLSGVVTLEACVNPAQPITFVLRPTDGTAPQTKTATLASDGSFTLSGVLTQNYTLWIKGAKWLARVIAADASSGSASGLAALLPAGDANDDNSVDTSDFGILVGAYNGDASVPGSGYDAAADFNCDGVVDTTDFGLLVGNYNAVGDN